MGWVYDPHLFTTVAAISGQARPGQARSGQGLGVSLVGGVLHTHVAIGGSLYIHICMYILYMHAHTSSSSLKMNMPRNR